jgi:hypothetical protein
MKTQRRTADLFRGGEGRGGRGGREGRRGAKHPPREVWGFGSCRVSLAAVVVKVVGVCGSCLWGTWDALPVRTGPNEALIRGVGCCSVEKHRVSKAQ